MFKVVEVNGFIRAQIDTKGNPNKYGEPKVFQTEKDAKKWIEKHSYKGMSFCYEIIPL